MPGAIATDRHTVAATDVLRVQRHRVRDAAPVDAQRRAVDVLQGVGWLVVVRVERLVRLAAPQPRLLGTLLLLCARGQSPPWATGPREAAALRPTAEKRVLGCLPGDRQIGDQRPLDAGRSLRDPRWALVGRRGRGLIAVVREIPGVR